MSTTYFGRFAKVFRDNIAARSRTAKDISDTSSSAEKKKLVKSGEELGAQVAENTGALIAAVWNSRDAFPENPAAIRAHMEEWYDIINRDLQDPDAYTVERHMLDWVARKRSRETGEQWKVNRRYRTWSVSYTSLNVPPLELEFAMDAFYRCLFDKIIAAQTEPADPAGILAFADHLIDGEIHPWTDGCGRNATAAVMWLSLLLQSRLPIFGARDEHYSSIRDLAAHTEYFRRCLSKT